jgi:RNA polymerase sporulation-specific sigma factor
MYNASKFPQALSIEETNRLLEKIQNDDEKAKLELVKHNLRLVAGIANHYYNYSYEKDDLISVGVIGLIKAANKFDYQRKVKFSSFAAKCINNEILMYLRKKKNKNTKEVSFDDFLFFTKDGNGIKIEDVVSDDNANVCEIAEEHYEHFTIRESLKTLTQLERDIIMLRYGFDDVPMSRTKLAEKLGCPLHIVQTAEIRAKRKIKNYIKMNKLL